VITEIYHYLICHSELQNFLITPRIAKIERGPDFMKHGV